MSEQSALPDLSDPESALPVVLTQGEPRWLTHDDDPAAVRGHRPDYLCCRRRPERWPDDETASPGSPVFVFSDTCYPWSAVGRLHVPGGWASGVLVGPRHLLTAAHVIRWARLDGRVTAVRGLRFAPAAFDEIEPFGSADVVAVYAVSPTDPPAIDEIEERVDYAVCVLDRAIGRSTGWMGARAYRDEWDGLGRWCLTGYQSRRRGEIRPTYQEGIALDGCDDEDDCQQVMYHRGDVHPGQSGGPVFGWWEAEDFPRVVAVQSWGWPQRAGASGGDRLVDLVIRARRDHR